MTEFVKAHTVHSRKGPVSNQFKYSLDYVLQDMSSNESDCLLFSRNSFNAMAVHDKDHGGKKGEGRGDVWVREILGDKGVTLLPTDRILLLTQPRALGHIFNPVSFWLVLSKASELKVVIAEVNNTYGDRHCYICKKSDGSPIGSRDVLVAEKIFYVSPFQPIAGNYKFRFHLEEHRVHIIIDLDHDNGGLYATLSGKRMQITSWRIIGSLLKRPFGSVRILGLIHWQAVKLWWKSVPFRQHVPPPDSNTSETT